MPRTTVLYYRPMIILFVLILPQIIFTQTDIRTYNGEMMDFWVGEWSLYWYGKDSTKIMGSNEIIKILDNKVIEENFKILAGPNKGYQGKSWSVYDEKGNNWKQTWVDTEGNYLDFKGMMVSDSVIFIRNMKISPTKDRQQRMIFYDISENELKWSWQHRDEKDTASYGDWVTDWLIYYERKE